MISLIIEMLWLSSALAVFASVVLFIMNPLYEFFMDSKYKIDTESHLYKQINEAVELAADQGADISVQIIVGDKKVEEEAEAKDSE